MPSAKNVTVTPVDLAHGGIVAPGEWADVADDDPRVASGALRFPTTVEDAAPPRSGGGSGRAPWQHWAVSRGVHVTEDMTRDDIIAAAAQDEE